MGILEHILFIILTKFPQSRGMVVCNSSEDYKILLSMRSHGWARNIKLDRKLKKKYEKIDNNSYLSILVLILDQLK